MKQFFQSVWSIFTTVIGVFVIVRLFMIAARSMNQTLIFWIIGIALVGWYLWTNQGRWSMLLSSIWKKSSGSKVLSYGLPTVDSDNMYSSYPILKQFVKTHTHRLYTKDDLSQLIRQHASGIPDGDYLAQQISSVMKEYVAVIPQSCTIDQDDLTMSKLGGKAFYDDIYSYPINKKGRPYVFLGQINTDDLSGLGLEEDVLLLPQHTIIQMFYDIDDYDESGHVARCIPLDYEPLKSTHIQNVQPIDLGKDAYSNGTNPFSGPEVLYSLSYIKTYGLPHEELICDMLDQRAATILRSVTDEEDEERYVALLEAIHGCYYNVDIRNWGAIDKIGGYSDFTQSPLDETDEWIQLFQFESKNDMMRGDAGIAHLYIKRKDLEDKNFDHTWFYWDCS